MNEKMFFLFNFIHSFYLNWVLIRATINGSIHCMGSATTNSSAPVSDDSTMKRKQTYKLYKIDIRRLFVAALPLVRLLQRTFHMHIFN